MLLFCFSLVQSERHVEPPRPTEEHVERLFSHHKKEIDPTYFPPKNEVLTVTATAYVAMCDTGCIGITKTGYNVRETVKTPQGRGIIAVDPKVIPLHSIVEIDGSEYRAWDTGGHIKGNRIDILVESHKKAINYGRKEIKVEILEKSS